MDNAITAIITTYKRPKLLIRALNSLLNQTYKNIQICVFDNASNDETEQIVKSFMLKDSRVKYHCHSENVGMMGNYQFAFSKIETPYFSLLSDDDFLFPGFYETALNGFKQCPDAAFSACAALAVDEANGKVKQNPLSLWQHEGIYQPPSCCFRDA